MIEIHVNTSDLERKLRGVVLGLQQPAELMEDLSAVMYNEVMKNFELQGRPTWAKLSPVTLAKKKGNRKLQEGGERSEDLMGSFEARVEGNAAIVSNAVTYAAVHNFGHTFNRKKKDGSEYKIVIPARPFMTIPASGRQALADACAEFLESLVRQS